MIHEIFQNNYWKAIFVVILALLITFAHEIDLLKDGVAAYVILTIFAVLIFAKEDPGLVILTMCLFAASYASVTFKPKNWAPPPRYPASQLRPTASK